MVWIKKHECKRGEKDSWTKLGKNELFRILFFFLKKIKEEKVRWWIKKLHQGTQNICEIWTGGVFVIIFFSK